MMAIYSTLPRATVLTRSGNFGISKATIDTSTSLHESMIADDDDHAIENMKSNNSRHARIAAVAGLGLATAALVGTQPSLAVDIASTAAGSASFVDSLTQTGFYQAFSLVFLSEIGDKTFFIAGLLAMKTSRVVSYVGSMGALAVMTVISVLIGQLFHAVPAGIAQGIPLDDVAAVLAFTFFGYKTLKEALEVDDDAPSMMDEEFDDAQEAVDGSETIKQVTAW